MIWRPISEAPHHQQVVVWTKSATWHKAFMRCDGKWMRANTYPLGDIPTHFMEIVPPAPATEEGT